MLEVLKTVGYIALQIGALLLIWVYYKLIRILKQTR